MKTASTLAQLGHYTDAATGAVAPPIHPATTFARDSDYALRDGWLYGRYANPTHPPVERVLADLEGAAEALLFSSGQAAAAALFETVATGRRIVAPDVMYHGLKTWLQRFSARRGVAVDFVDVADPEAVRRAMRPETDLVWTETFLNPTWDVVDIAALAEIAHGAGAALAVDSTVTPPVALRPIALGADVVMHSATKYLNGHSDVTAGALATARADDRWAEVVANRRGTGGILGPFEAWLLGRGLRTLAVRWDRASANAMAVAEALAAHPAVERALYPGLPDHPGRGLAARQMEGGFGAMLSFLVAGGEDAARRVAQGCELILPATSLGGVESLIEHRAAVEPEGSLVPRNLIRLSVGIEDAGDLIADLTQALDGA